MKVLKILGIVFGILLLLTGGGLLAGSAIVGKGQSAFDSELAKQGFAGPVNGTVKSIDSTSPVLLTVTFNDRDGHSQTGQGASSNTVVPKVGDTVPVYYQTSDPTQIVIVDVPGAGSLSKVGSALQTGGIVCLVIGAVLLLAGIVGLVMGKKAPPVAAAQAGAPLAPGSDSYPPGAPPSPQGPGYPPQGPPPGYPASKGKSWGEGFDSGPPGQVCVADPVDLLYGFFIEAERDLYVDDVVPIDFTRTYRNSGVTKSFGLDASNPYEAYLVFDADNTRIELTMGDGRIINFDNPAGAAVGNFAYDQ